MRIDNHYRLRPKQSVNGRLPKQRKVIAAAFMVAVLPLPIVFAYTAALPMAVLREPYVLLWSIYTNGRVLVAASVAKERFRTGGRVLLASCLVADRPLSRLVKAQCRRTRRARTW